MRSTGEVLGLSENFALAFYKSQEAAGTFLPSELEPVSGAEVAGKVLISLSEKDGQAKEAIAVGKAFSGLGFTILATEGTASSSPRPEFPAR
jgi:carbamoyl-phosphate synthase large subunit